MPPPPPPLLPTRLAEQAERAAGQPGRPHRHTAGLPLWRRLGPAGAARLLQWTQWGAAQQQLGGSGAACLQRQPCESSLHRVGGRRREGCFFFGAGAVGLRVFNASHVSLHYIAGGVRVWRGGQRVFAGGWAGVGKGPCPPNCAGLCSRWRAWREPVLCVLWHGMPEHAMHARMHAQVQAHEYITWPAACLPERSTPMRRTGWHPVFVAHTHVPTRAPCSTALPPLPTPSPSSCPSCAHRTS